MATVTFDKLKYLETLKAGGVPDNQARVHAEALDDALRDSVATKTDIAELKALISETKAEIIKWMFGVALGIIGALVALLKLIP